MGLMNIEYSHKSQLKIAERKGHAEGEHSDAVRSSKLFDYLLENNDIDIAKKAAKDITYRNELMHKLGI